jgi:hypothetical protein
VYFQNYMVDTHVIPKLHNCKNSMHLMFPGLHGVFLELDGIQPCNSRNTKMNVHVPSELHGVFPELHG